MAGKNRERDSAMAADLKSRGVRRTSARCSVCGGVQSIDAHPDRMDGTGQVHYVQDLYAHIAFRCGSGGSRVRATG